MKTFLRLIIGMICLFPWVNVFGQNDQAFSDSIFYHGNGKMDMLIVIKDYHLLAKNDQVSAVLKDFQDRINEVIGSIPQTAYTIEYQFQKNLDILGSNKLKSYSLKDGKEMVENFRNQAFITDGGNDFHITVNFNEIGDLIQADVSAILSQIIKDLPEKHRFMRYLEFQPDQQNGKIMLTENRHTGYFDMLSLQAGVGANVYRSKFLTDITGEIGLQLNHKGILRNQFYVSNNLMFAFDAENNALINNFTNFGYRRNLSNKRDSPNWLGVEIGTLTKKSGDIFQPNTMRLGVNWNAGKHITVSPQLYWNGFFQQVSPGFRIGIGL